MTDRHAEGHVVVIGGANLDVLARSGPPMILGTSNPGRVTVSAGGVGRNIAENLARLGTPTHLVTDLGDDPAGEQVWEATAGAGVEMTLVRRTAQSTGAYVVTLDDQGEMIVAVAHMDAAYGIGPDRVEEARAIMRTAAMLVLDGNLSVPTLERALVLARECDVPVLLDPVSVPKAQALLPAMGQDRAIHTLTPNRDELAALTDRSVDPADLSAVTQAARLLLTRGVERVWVRLGERGSVLVTAHDATPLPPATVVGGVLDVTGAGDSSLAGYAHALLGGADPVDAANFGHRVAALTIASPHTVRPDLSSDLVRSSS